MELNKNFTFATSKVRHSLSALITGKEIIRTLSGEPAHGELDRVRCFWTESINASENRNKPATGGRNKAGKCSPKKRSTLPRRPKLQEYLFRLINAVLNQDFRDGSQSSQAKCGKVQRTNLPFSISTDCRTSKQISFNIL